VLIDRDEYEINRNWILELEIGKRIIHSWEFAEYSNSWNLVSWWLLPKVGFQRDFYKWKMSQYGINDFDRLSWE